LLAGWAAALVLLSLPGWAAARPASPPAPSHTAAFFPAAPSEPTPWRVTPHFRFYRAGELGPTAPALADTAEARLGRICQMLDACDALRAPANGVPRPIEVWLAADPQRFAAALGNGAAPLSEWAAGVAWPAARRVVLRVHGSALLSLADTFDHEVSHVVAYVAAGGRPLPRWFAEGVAIWQAGEDVLSRLQTAAGAALTHDLLDLRALTNAFPEGGRAVPLAYAESALFVHWLVRQRGPGAVPRVFRALREGRPFEEAFRDTFGAPAGALFERWADELREGSSMWTVLRDGNLLWGVMVLLLVLAGLRVRRQRQAALAAMSEGEAIEDAYEELERARERGHPPTLH